MSEWISVIDGLPQADFEVLVVCDDDVTLSIYREGFIEGENWFDIEADKNWNVTHWMPLPEPPKESVE